MSCILRNASYRDESSLSKLFMNNCIGEKLYGVAIQWEIEATYVS